MIRRISGVFVILGLPSMFLIRIHLNRGKTRLVSPTSGLYGSAYPGCAPSRIHNFEFRNTQRRRNAAMIFLRDSIPDGSFVVVRFTPRSGAVNQYASAWLGDEWTYGAGNSMYTELKNQGFTDIDSSQPSKGFQFCVPEKHAATHPPEFIISPNARLILLLYRPTALRLIRSVISSRRRSVLPRTGNNCIGEDQAMRQAEIPR